MNKDDVTGIETSLPFGPEEAERADDDLKKFDQSELQTPITVDDLKMIASIFGEKGKIEGMYGVDESFVDSLTRDYKPVDLRTVESVDEIEGLVARTGDKGGVILASGGPHQAYFGHAGKGVTIGYEGDDGPKKEGPVYIHNPVESLIAQNVQWIKANVPGDLVTAINNYVKNGHEFGNGYDWDKAVCLLWEKPGRFMIIDQGTKYFSVGEKETAQKRAADVAMNNCPTLMTDFLDKFDHNRYFAIMRGQQKVGTMLYLLTGNAEPHSKIAEIEDVQVSPPTAR